MLKSREYDAVVATPLPGIGARLGIRIEAGRLSLVKPVGMVMPEQAPSSGIAREVIQQLEGYFGNGEWCFSLPVSKRGTDHQLRVWNALGEIPPGETMTYGELARHLGSGPRAVGNACRSNPVPIVVPCHRVVSATGLGGFMGDTAGEPMAIKSWLLRHELNPVS